MGIAVALLLARVADGVLMIGSAHDTPVGFVLPAISNLAINDNKMLKYLTKHGSPQAG